MVVAKDPVHDEKLGGKVWNKLYEQTLERAAASPLMYGLFALETQNESLIVGAKAQLNRPGFIGDRFA